MTPFLRDQPGGVLLAVKVTPRASRNEMGGPLGAELRIKLTAPPVDNAANAALVRFLAEVLDCPGSAIQLVRGGASRHKLLSIKGMTAAQVAACLEPG